MPAEHNTRWRPWYQLRWSQDMLKVTWEYAIQPENLEGLALPIAYGGEHVAQPCYLTKAEESEDWRGFLARMEQERCQYCQRYRGHGAVCGRCWRM